MNSSDALDAAEVLVICGPTGAGKSALAMQLAERFPVAIVSADSRAVYRGMDIGTSKADAASRERVPHYGLDLVQPTERYSAAAWADAADLWIDETRARGLEPIVVGGTGFYLRSLFDPLFEEPELDPERRTAVGQVLEQLPVSELARWVAEIDPPRAHLGRAQLLRALEIALLTGQRLSDLHRQRARPPRRLPRYLLVDPGPRLSARIEARVDWMLANGWPGEVQRLIKTVPSDAPAWNATGYRTVRQLVQGEIAADEARRLINIETRQYAKRQRTWFRNQLPVHRVTHVDPEAPDLADRLERWWRQAHAETPAQRETEEQPQ